MRCPKSRTSPAALVARGPEIAERAREARSQRFVFVHEINVSPIDVLRGDAFRPRRELVILVVGTAQAQITPIGSRDERRFAFIGVGDTEDGCPITKRLMDFLVLP